MTLTRADFEEGPAVFSPDRMYRYTLERNWKPKLGRVAFIGLNPSTADEHQLDPTLRRCVDFTHRWGYGAFTMLNLFAFRATAPRDMMRSDNPVGPSNNAYIRKVACKADKVICAWSSMGGYLDRSHEVRAMLEDLGVILYVLKLNQNGEPAHPLYIRGDTEPELWTP